MNNRNFGCAACSIVWRASELYDGSGSPCPHCRTIRHPLLGRLPRAGKLAAWLREQPQAGGARK